MEFMLNKNETKQGKKKRERDSMGNLIWDILTMKIMFPEKIPFPHRMNIFLLSTYLTQFPLQIIMNTSLGVSSIRMSPHKLGNFPARDFSSVN